MVTDRGTQNVPFIASSEGGMDIEQVAHDTPEKIITIELTAEEKAMLDKSAAAVRELIEAAKKL